MSSSLNIQGLEAVTWTFTGVALVMSAGRFMIRWRLLHRWQGDDYVHAVTMALLIAYIATYQKMFPLAYQVQLASAGMGPDPGYHVEFEYFHYELAVSAMFWVVIYLVKFSFLMLYKQIFGISKTFMKAWWAVAIYTLATFCVCFVSVFWACVWPTFLFDVDVCLSTQATEQSNVVLIIWCVLMTTSDITIMVLPLWMLARLHMNLFHKIGLASIFLLVWIDIVFDILRTYHTIGGTTSLSTLWDILEPTIAVIIATMPTYRSLYGYVKREHFSSAKSKETTTSPDSQRVLV